MHHSQYRLLYLLIMLAFAASACNFGHEPTPAPKLEYAVEDPNNFDLPVDSMVRRNEAILAERPDFIGRIVFVRENKLYKFTSDVVEPELIATDIDPDTIFRSPDKRNILFATSDYANRAIYRTNWRSKKHVKLLDLQHSNWRPYYWSPDGEWVVVLVGFQNLILLKLDGTVQHNIGSSSTDVLWLSDGNILIFDRNPAVAANTINDEPRFTEAAIVNAFTGERTLLEIDLDQLSRDWGLMIRALNRLGLSIVDVPWQAFASTRYRAVPSKTASELSGTSPYCQPWQISPVVTTSISLFEANDVYRLTDLRDLPDGSLMYLEWTMPSCTITTPNVALVQLQFERDGTATTRILIEHLFGGVGIGQVSSYDQEDSALYSLLPDGKTMLWIGGDYAEYETSLNLLNVETGENSILFHDVFGALRSTSLPFITSVFWVAP